MVGEALAAQSRSKRAAADRGRQEKQTQDEGKRQRENQEEPASQGIHAGRGRLQDPRRRGGLAPGNSGLRLCGRCTNRARAHRQARRHRSNLRRDHPLGPRRLPRPRQTRTTRPADGATLCEVRRGRRQIGRSGKNVTTRMRGRDGSNRGLCRGRDWSSRGLACRRDRGSRRVGCRRDDARRCRGSQASGSGRHLCLRLRDRCGRLVRCAAGRRSGSLILRLVGLILPCFV
jgi:hypothetical protein